MTYQVLARKWRPQSFKEVAGQSHVLKTLINSLDNNRLHHAYLFTGTRGVGKTTLARILARCLNCEKGVTSEPCGQCSACLEIDAGNFIDLIEVDAASRTKVEDTRELLENVQYAPSKGRYKVYLIDEVHMLSGHSFNALLKTLEEPPPHVKFLLATTDPQKLPVTILSRCLQFSLKNLSPELIMNHLKYILEQENLTYDEEALWLLGRAAKGSVRDALTLLDQAIAYCNENIELSQVRDFLGTIDQSVIHDLVGALAEQDGKLLLAKVEEAAEHSPDFASILNELISYLHRVAIAQVVPDAIDNSQGDRKNVLDHAQSIPAEAVQLFYQIGIKGKEDLPLATDTRSGLEMVLLRMLAFTPKGVPSASGGKLRGSDEPQVRDATEDLKKKSLDKFTKSIEQSRKAATPEPSLKVSSLPVVPDRTSLTDTDLSLASLEKNKWIPLFYALDLQGITKSIAANCTLETVSGENLVLKLDESQSAVYSEEQLVKINQAIEKFYNRPVHLKIEIGAVTEETPAVYKTRMEAERLHQAINTFENDANVREIIERFGARIETDSIVPLTPKKY